MDGCKQEETINTQSLQCSVQAALAKLMLDTQLKISTRNRRFLDFVVRETLAGRSDRIKAYSIAVDVFGRSEDFDPSTDPIVRIEATRLRSALCAYYEGCGADDEIRILLPPGGYIPSFAWADGHHFEVAISDRQPQLGDANSSDEPIELTGSAVTILIQQHAPPEDRLSEALIQEVAESVLARLSHQVRVICMPPPERKAVMKAIEKLLSEPEAAYALDLTIRSNKAHSRCSWLLTDLSSGEVIECNFLEWEKAQSDQNWFADDIAARIAERAVQALPNRNSRNHLS